MITRLIYIPIEKAKHDTILITGIRKINALAAMFLQLDKNDKILNLKLKQEYKTNKYAITFKIEHQDKRLWDNLIKNWIDTKAIYNDKGWIKRIQPEIERANHIQQAELHLKHLAMNATQRLEGPNNIQNCGNHMMDALIHPDLNHYEISLPALLSRHPYLSDFAPEITHLPLINQMIESIPILLLNINGLTKSKISINGLFYKNLVLPNKILILAITETHIQHQHTPPLIHNMTCIFHINAKTNKSGGIALYVHDSILGFIKYTKQPSEHEYVQWFQLNTNSTDPPHNIALCYITPRNSKHNKAIKAINKLNKEISTKKANGAVTIIGDLNARLGSRTGDTQTNIQGQKLITLIASHKLHIINSIYAFGTPTLSNNNGKSIIDLVLSTHPQQFNSLRIHELPTNTKDHKAVITEIQTKLQSTNETTKIYDLLQVPSNPNPQLIEQYRSRIKCCTNKYRQALKYWENHINLFQPTTNAYISNWMGIYRTFLTTNANLHTWGLKYVTGDQNWHTTSLDLIVYGNSIRYSQQLLNVVNLKVRHIEAHDSPDQVLKLKPIKKQLQTAQQQQKSMVQQYQNAKLEHEWQIQIKRTQHYCHKNNSDRSKTTKNMINNLIRSKIPEICIDKGKQFHTIQGIKMRQKQIFNILYQKDRRNSLNHSKWSQPVKEYQAILGKLPPTNLLSVNKINNLAKISTPTIQPRYQNSSHIIHKQEVFNAIHTLQKTAPGINNHSNINIKTIPPEMAEYYTTVFNSWIWMDHTAEIDKISTINPLIKSTQKPYSDMNNYRPISLLSAPYKLYERIIYNKLYDQYNEHIHPHQGGFRKNRGTKEQLIHIKNIANKFLSQHKGKFTKDHSTPTLLIASLDISKAFDGVWRPGMLYQLHKTKIFSEQFIKLIHNNYTNTKSRIRLNNKNTSTFQTTNGVLQGSILAPMLYGLFINSLIEYVHKKLKRYKRNNGLWNYTILLYADDITIITDDIEIMSTILRLCEEHANNWGYKFNPDKCKILMFNKGTYLHDRYRIHDPDSLRQHHNKFHKELAAKTRNDLKQTNLEDWIIRHKNTLIIPVTILETKNGQYKIIDTNDQQQTVPSNTIPDSIIETYNKYKMPQFPTSQAYTFHWDFMRPKDKQDLVSKIQSKCKLNDKPLQVVNSLKLLGATLTNSDTLINNKDNLNRSQQKVSIAKNNLHNLPIYLNALGHDRTIYNIKTYMIPHLDTLDTVLDQPSEQDTQITSILEKCATKLQLNGVNHEELQYGIGILPTDIRWSIRKYMQHRKIQQSQSLNHLSKEKQSCTAHVNEFINMIFQQETQKIRNKEANPLPETPQIKHYDNKTLFSLLRRGAVCHIYENRLNVNSNFKHVKYKPTKPTTYHIPTPQQLHQFQVTLSNLQLFNQILYFPPGTNIQNCPWCHKDVRDLHQHIATACSNTNITTIRSKFWSSEYRTLKTVFTKKGQTHSQEYAHHTLKTIWTIIHDNAQLQDSNPKPIDEFWSILLLANQTNQNEQTKQTFLYKNTQNTKSRYFLRICSAAIKWHSIVNKITNNADYMHNILNKLQKNTKLKPEDNTNIPKTVKNQTDLDALLLSQTPSTVITYVDGSELKHQQIKAAGAGITISTQTGQSHISIPLGEQTNNMAEWWAMNTALDLVTHHKVNPDSHPSVIFTDSQLVFDAIYTTNNKPSFPNFTRRAKAKIFHHNITIHKIKAHNKLTGNERADKLAKEASAYSLKNTITPTIYPQILTYQIKGTKTLTQHIRKILTFRCTKH